MRLPRAVTVLGLAAGCVLTTAGCSIVDEMIWGNDGAEVIRTTETLLADLASRGTSEILCDGFVGELGMPADWAGRGPGEPEPFAADFWEDQAALDPQWSINLEGHPEGLAVGETFPGDVFFREAETGLCAVDIAWPTLLADG